MSYTHDTSVKEFYDEGDEPKDAAADTAAAVDDNGDDDDEEGQVDKTKWPEIHVEALEEYARAYLRERSNMEEAYDDLRFRRGHKEDQWPPEALAVREGRPCQVINMLPQFVRQVTGDQRKMRPAINVVPVDSNADVDVADIRGGIIRYVENRSHAKYVYNQGGDSQATCGIGHWEVITELAHATTFNQEIRISLIEDGVAVLWDADSKELTREDADHCFVPNDKTTALFAREWPDAKADGFDTLMAGVGATSGAFDSWISDDYIRVVVYWKKKPCDRWLALLKDGSIVDLTADWEKAEITDPQICKDAVKQLKAQGARVEKRKSYKLCRYLLTMAEILEEKEWPGMHIPVVPCIGEEVRIARQVYRHGIIRNAKELQRKINYFSSAETEIIALQPKAPYLGTKKMFQDRYDLWDTANTENHPFLEYEIDPLAPNAKPERVAPPQPSQAIQLALETAKADMKEVIGIYNSSLGAQSNEKSGIAIKARDAQADTGTFVYIDNMALAVARTGMIIDDLAPHIYDTERQMRIVGKDNRAKLITLNKVQVVDGKTVTENDLSVGAYGVEMEQGPSYATKREDTRDSQMAFIQAVPAAAPLVGDLIAKEQDWPGAEEFGERLQEMLPPPIKAKLEAEKAAREQASGKPPKPPSPQQQQQIAAQQQAQAKQQALQEQEVALKMAEQQAKTDKMEADARKANAEADLAEQKAKAFKAETARSHMTELRSIEKNDHEVEGLVQGRAHAQDRHAADMTQRGLAGHSALQGIAAAAAAANAGADGDGADPEGAADQGGEAPPTPAAPAPPAPGLTGILQPQGGQ